VASRKAGAVDLGEKADHLEGVMPTSRRDSTLRMALVWITFQATLRNM
jgi:hypothetical protein